LMSDKAVKIVVKYCGGCNPLYDRVALVRRIEERFCDSVRLVSVDEGEGDAALVVHGCYVRCAGTTELSHLPIFSVCRPEDIDDLKEHIQTMLDTHESEEPSE